MGIVKLSQSKMKNEDKSVENNDEPSHDERRKKRGREKLKIEGGSDKTRATDQKFPSFCVERIVGQFGQIMTIFAWLQPASGTFSGY